MTKLEWFSDRPGQEGFYWLARGGDMESPLIVQVLFDEPGAGRVVSAMATVERLDEVEGLWAGPLKAPAGVSRGAWPPARDDPYRGNEPRDPEAGG